MADITRPIEPFELTQEFGVNEPAYRRFGLKGHNGWDLRTKYPDTPAGHRYILASWLMEFYRQGNEGNDGFGLFFENVCRLFSTWKLTFAHCDSIESFTTKNEGDHMGISDNTGNSTGPHLHLTTKRIKIVNGQHQVQDYDNGFFGAVNPQEFFDELRKYKAQGIKPQTGPALTMTIDGKLYEHLVEGATVRKELAQNLKDGGANGFDDPDHAPLTSFKNHIAGLKSRSSDLEKQLNTEKTERAKAETEVANKTDQLANERTEWQRTLGIEKARYDTLNKSIPDVSKLDAQYKGEIVNLQGVVRELQKAGGEKDLKITGLESELTQLRKGTVTTAVAIQVLLDYLGTFLKR